MPARGGRKAGARQGHPTLVAEPEAPEKARMTTILIVEDEKPLVKILKYNLEKEGYRAVACDDGEKGLEAFKKEKPDLVILDLMLPKLDGYEFCRRVRAHSKTPILMLTAR